MRLKPLLRVSILYEAPLSKELCNRLVDYFATFASTARLRIAYAYDTRKITCIAPDYYNPVFNTEFTYFIKTEDELYQKLLSLIYLALKVINEHGYYSTENELTILVPTTFNDDSSFTLGWRLHY
ncbi:MAG: hypothetical protein RSA51_09530 [Niameybacter sp.]